MGGFDDHVAMMGDWMIGDNVVATQSNVDAKSENKSGAPLPGNAVHKDPSNSNGVAQEKAGYRGGGLMERRAGFNAQRLDPESMKPHPAYFSKDPGGVRSPLFTIPPGLSPTALLDSPVFLSNSLVVPSPTTGKFSLMADNSDKGKENTFENINASSFAFKPVSDSSSYPYFNAVNKVNSSGFAPQSFPSIGISVQNFQQANFAESRAEEVNRGSNLNPEQTYKATTAAEQHSSPLDETTHEDDGGYIRSSGDSNADEDGYNWRKYGQKQVKGSEYPRSYFKCTHPNCPVKKKVERSHEGHITEIVYKGSHNHPKPPPANRRSSAFASSNSPTEMQLDSEQSGTVASGDLHNGNALGPVDLRQENLEAQNDNGSANLQAQNGAKYEPLDGSSNFLNDEDDDDRATHGSASLGYDGEGEESESKRRRIECYASDVSGATRPIREPRVVVQTTSEVDILDDGYRWRKYGQKVVKGNPNPRSYYKCTSPNCNVRKHVERASHDLKSVITTYEGKHNHDVPAARNSSHINSASSSNLLHNTHQTTTAAAASRHLHRPEPSQIGMPHFERDSLGSYGFPGRPPLRPGPPGFGYGINQPGLSGLGLPGDFPVFRLNHPYLHHQARPMSDMGFVVPKREPGMELVTDSGLVDPADASVYQQYMSHLELGPQI